MNGTTTIRRAYRRQNTIVVETTHNKYVFSTLRGDRVRGGMKKDLEGCYAYTGDSGSNNYIAEKSPDEVPDAVLEAAAEYGTIVRNVDGGWASWDGRPEFSTSYVDVSEAEVVDV
jgi:hypothetical protein